MPTVDNTPQPHYEWIWERINKHSSNLSEKIYEKLLINAEQTAALFAVNYTFALIAGLISSLSIILIISMLLLPLVYAAINYTYHFVKDSMQTNQERRSFLINNLMRPLARDNLDFQKVKQSIQWKNTSRDDLYFMSYRQIHELVTTRPESLFSRLSIKQIEGIQKIIAKNVNKDIFSAEVFPLISSAAGLNTEEQPDFDELALKQELYLLLEESSIEESQLHLNRDLSYEALQLAIPQLEASLKQKKEIEASFDGMSLRDSIFTAPTLDKLVERLAATLIPSNEEFNNLLKNHMKENLRQRKYELVPKVCYYNARRSSGEETDSPQLRAIAERQINEYPSKGLSLPYLPS